MALPGFTAEASVGPTTQVYRMQDRYGTAEGVHLHLQSNGEEWDEGLGDDGETMDMLEEETMDMAEEEGEVGDEV
ncbi:MAG: hypothetical protein H8K10_05950 [Nitrospira sp.]|nr:hypothetical protein [Nitrospira sp.]